MKLNQPLQHGTLIKRYKRFLADIKLDTGEIITAHCANPGAMTGFDMPGLGVWLSKSDNPKRKLPLSWELVELESGLVGINTALPNKIVAEALAAKKIKQVSAYGTIRPEVKYGEKSRVDFLLTEPGLPDCYLEVKTVHLSRTKDLAEFPDSKTERGAKHLHELAKMKEAGHRAINLYLIQRDDCINFQLASDVDPNYSAAFALAASKGVEMLAYSCNLSTHEIVLDRQLPILSDESSAK